MKTNKSTKMKTLTITVASVMGLVAASNAALTIVTTNVLGFDATTAAVVNSTGTAIADGAGVVAVGSFAALTDIQIQALDSGGNISAAFTEVGTVTMGFAEIAGLWQDTVTNSGSFAGLAAFTIVGNAATVALSDEFLIYRHTNLNGTGNFVDDPSLNGNAQVSIADGGTLVVGNYGTFTNDFGAGAFDAYSTVAVTAVPEPSSTALLGLGGLALILRRRK